MRPLSLPQSSLQALQRSHTEKKDSSRVTDLKNNLLPKNLKSIEQNPKIDPFKNVSKTILASMQLGTKLSTSVNHIGNQSSKKLGTGLSNISKQTKNSYEISSNVVSNNGFNTGNIARPDASAKRTSNSEPQSKDGPITNQAKYDDQAKSNRKISPYNQGYNRADNNKLIANIKSLRVFQSKICSVYGRQKAESIINNIVDDFTKKLTDKDFGSLGSTTVVKSFCKDIFEMYIVKDTDTDTDTDTDKNKNKNKNTDNANQNVAHVDINRLKITDKLVKHLKNYATSPQKNLPKN